MRIYELTLATPCRVLQLTGSFDIIERLEEMGLSVGRSLLLVRKIPFGGPYIIQVGTSFLALREEEMQCLEVEPWPQGALQP